MRQSLVLIHPPCTLGLFGGHGGSFGSFGSFLGFLHGLGFFATGGARFVGEFCPPGVSEFVGLEGEQFERHGMPACCVNFLRADDWGLYLLRLRLIRRFGRRGDAGRRFWRRDREYAAVLLFRLHSLVRFDMLPQDFSLLFRHGFSRRVGAIAYHETPLGPDRLERESPELFIVGFCTLNRLSGAFNVQNRD